MKLTASDVKHFHPRGTISAVFEPHFMGLYFGVPIYQKPHLPSVRYRGKYPFLWVDLNPPRDPSGFPLEKD